MIQDHIDSEGILSNILKTIHTPIFHSDREGRIVLCSDKFCHFIGLERDSILGKKPGDVFPDKLVETLEAADKVIDVENQEFRMSLSLRFNGIDELLHICKKGLFDLDGLYQGSSTSIQLINQLHDFEHHSQRILRLKDAILSINNYIKEVEDIISLFDLILEKVLTAVDHATVGCVLLLDENGMLRIVSSIGYGISTSSSFSIRVEDTFHWKEANSEPRETLIINDLQKFMIENNMPDTLLSDESSRTIRSTMSTPLIVEDKLYGLINLDSSEDNVFDETDRALLECIRSQVPIAINMFNAFERTVFESEHDQLTGLFNRRYFENVYSMIQKKARRYQDVFLMILFDLNYFKEVNDTYGHPVGDEILCYFAKEMSDWFRNSDVFARYGGDEFIAVMFNADEEQCRKRLEEKRLEMLRMPLKFEEHQIVCSFSYGIVSFGRDGKDYDTLLSKADKRMYEHKSMVKSSVDRDHS